MTDPIAIISFLVFPSVSLQEMKKVEAGASIQAAMNDGDYNTAFKLMKDSGTFPDRIGGVPFGLVVEQAGLEPHVVMGPTALSFGREAALSFGREEMVAAEEMQRAFSSGNLKKLFEIINSTSIRPEKIGGEPFETALRSHGIDASRGIPGSAPKYLFYKAASGKYPSTDFFPLPCADPSLVLPLLRWPVRAGADPNYLHTPNHSVPAHPNPQFTFVKYRQLLMI